MLLAVDVGNSTVAVAIFAADEIVFKNWLTTPDEVTEKFVHSIVKRDLIGDISDVIVSSVVPLVDRSLADSLKAIFGKEPIFIDHKSNTGLQITTDKPEELGADLIAGAVGGLHFYRPPLIIIDSGTAITFAAVNRDCEYLGGAILPGIEVAVRSLASNAAKLERINFWVPQSAVGTNTAECIRAGLFYTYLGGLQLMIGEYKKLLGDDARVIVTGGLIRYFKDRLNGIDRYEPDLIFYGLKKIFALQ